MTVCRDLTVKETVQEVKKKPIEFKYRLGTTGSGGVAKPSQWKHIDKLYNIDYGRCLMAAYDTEDCEFDKKAFYIGYWNDGVAE